MKNILESDIYIEDIKKIATLDFINYSELHDKSILISGATGLIGSFLIDVIMHLNINIGLNCKIYALGRNKLKAIDRFEKYYNDINFELIEADINLPLEIDSINNIDFIIHLASNTHPKAYSTDPIGTISTNIIGTKNLLDFGEKKNVKRFVFSSTCEVYGENRGDTDKFEEKYLGYIDCNTMRAGYPESKRCGEALCQAYIKQKNMDIVVPRLTRTFGPTMLMNDSKALSQFIKNALNNEDIVLKSEGNQFYSYTYVADAVSGVLKIMLDGKCGEAYNVSDERCDITLKELSQLIASIADTKVVFELPDEIEKAGFSKATKAILDNNKLKLLGWESQYDLKSAILNTINILKEIY